MKTASLPSFCVMVLLLTLAGCSSYEPKIHTAAKPPEPPTHQQIMTDLTKAASDLGREVAGIHDKETALAAAPKVTEIYDRFKSLYANAKAIQKKHTPEEDEQIETDFNEKIIPAQVSAGESLKNVKKTLPVIPPELDKAFTQGRQSLQKAKEEAEEHPAVIPTQILPENPPKNASVWVVWLLCVLIMVVCVGLLFRDGIWSNALRLVNVVFSGLLAMNFYEPLANWMTKYNDDIHSFVPFLDFLALWACFVACMIIFRTLTDSVSKVRVRFLQVVDFPGGIVLSLIIGWIMTGFALTSLHCGPLAQYPLLGSFQPQNKMFLGMLAPDREWLGFTKYQSAGPYCRSVDAAHAEQCVFPSDFIETQLQRRMHIENYINGNADRAIRVNPLFMTGSPNPAPKKPAP